MSVKKIAGLSAFEASFSGVEELEVGDSQVCFGLSLIVVGMLVRAHSRWLELLGGRNRQK